MKTTTNTGRNQKISRKVQEDSVECIKTFSKRIQNYDKKLNNK